MATCFKPRWLVLLLLLSGCQTQPLLNGHFDPTLYVVSPGDSVYSISWRYQLDFNDVIAWNGLQDPFVIHPGDRLMLRPPPGAPMVAVREKPSSPPPPAQEEAVIAIPLTDNDAEVFDSRPLKGESLPPVSTPQPVKPSVVTVAKASPVPESQHRKEVLKAADLSTHARDGVTWSWPAQGEVVKHYRSSEMLQEGLNIAGKRDQPVYAAASGVVVYAGNAIPRYGNLLIVKHNSKYLSAYAYNSRLLVREGDKVKRGEGIARMGDVESGRAILYFELRQNGKPVNPLPFLPR